MTGYGCVVWPEHFIHSKFKKNVEYNCYFCYNHFTISLVLDKTNLYQQLDIIIIYFSRKKKLSGVYSDEDVPIVKSVHTAFEPCPFVFLSGFHCHN